MSSLSRTTSITHSRSHTSTVALAILLAGWGGSPQTSATELIQNTSVCNLHASRHATLSSRVRLEATLYMGPRHGAFLKDKACLKGAYVGMRFANDISNDPMQGEKA